jgi:hypothetical protein
MRRLSLVTVLLFGMTLALGASLMAAGQMGGNPNAGYTTMSANQMATYSPEVSKDWTEMQYQAIKLVGKSKDDVIQELGKPNVIFNDDPAGTRYQYEWRLTGLPGANWAVEDFVIDASGKVLRYSLDNH